MTIQAETATTAADPEVSSLTDPQFLSALREQMLRFAKLQLTDAQLAEDAVQEALIGALKNAGSFRRQAALKTWVFAILRNKITDILRQRQRTSEASQFDDDGTSDKSDHLFDQKGHWYADQKPAQWTLPSESVKSAHFWRVFEACLEHLPEKQSRLFMMREFLELDTSEICSTLEISTSNLHVMLHRARLRLRDCLENKWFMKGADT